MTRWNLSIPDATDRKVRAFLGRTGFKKGDLSSFVDNAVRKEILLQAVLQIQEQNADLSPDEAMNLANEAVDWARAHPS